MGRVEIVSFEGPTQYYHWAEAPIWAKARLKVGDTYYWSDTNIVQCENRPTPAILPCPFCGGDGKVEGERSGFVYCKTCRTSGAIADSLEEAIRNWNRRV